MSLTPTSKTTGSLNVGDTWEVGVLVKAAKGTAVDSSVAVVVTDSIGATHTLAVSRNGTGKYVGSYVLAQPGRHVAVATAAEGVASFAVTAKVATVDMPTREDVVAYMAQSGLTYADDQIGDALATEQAAQENVCKVAAAYPADLREALLRRVHRNLAMRNVPLGVQTDEVAGATRIGSVDPEVRRLEGPYRKRSVG